MHVAYKEMEIIPAVKYRELLNNRESNEAVSFLIKDRNSHTAQNTVVTYPNGMQQRTTFMESMEQKRACITSSSLIIRSMSIHISKWTADQ